MLDIHEQMKFVAKPLDHPDDLALRIGVLFATPGRHGQTVWVQDDLVVGIPCAGGG